MSEQYPGGPPPPYPGGYPPPSPGAYPPASPVGYPQPYPAAGYAPPPAVPAPAPLPRFPHPEPREYHQMLRTWNYAWWKPVLGLVLVLLGTVLVAPLVLLPVLVVGVMIEGGPFWENFEQAATLQAIGPASLLYLNLTLGSTILVTWLVMRVLHRMRPRWLTSVVPKMRWKFFFICIGLSVVALVAQLVVGLLIPGNHEAQFEEQLNDFTSTTAVLALIVLLTTPLQAAGEEYVFRGYALQALGSFWSFSRVPSWVAKAIALFGTALAFAFAHGVQNFPLFFDRFMFGLIVGCLVIATGGLEAAIAMHILNNFLAFGFTLAFSDLTETLNVSEVSWSNIPLTLTQSITYAVLVLLLAKKLGLQRRTRPPARQVPHDGVNVLTYT